MISFLKYKAMEDDLKARFAKLDLVVCVEPIEHADVYYTDGDAILSFCKLIFTGGKTVYLPQLIYNVDPVHKQIIEEWVLSIPTK